MSKSAQQADIRRNRLDKDEIARNFSDLHPPLSRSEALIEADRCYFCYDAPCTTACPTGIDIPGFIQKIRSDNIRGSAHTILRENIMGGMCARVCPTEVLCEEACVRNTHEEKPVEIGLLQRYATDPIFDQGTPLFSRAAATGKKVAVVGAGPAGLSCAHRLAMLGHDVVVLNRDLKPGGLNEYGIAAYKTIDDFAQKEVEYILSIGGIELRNGETLGKDFTLQELRDAYDAVFIGIGLGSTNALGLDRESLTGVGSAIEYIAEIRQADDLGKLPVGRRVVVIGGGMTAIDIAVQSKRLGAEVVDLVYRRGPEQMGASRYEQDLAQTNGVKIHHWAQPVELRGDDHVTNIRFERTALGNDGRLSSQGDGFELTVDTVFKAIGQILDVGVLSNIPELEFRHDRIVVNEAGRTTLRDVWAGGDCVAAGDDLTVTAVQQGKVAAIDIDRRLRGK
ncbi:MAG: NAD(P)-dependent oxidoreductase [Gammaproteobacteria bacterium]|nr:NAD(P)-dependent oxidoreductase [Gammaproteobacteria bacterium]MDH3577296.1 NAD(P)-dependent oxidoreductase [Gammaproteobacteria bacterium]